MGELHGNKCKQTLADFVYCRLSISHGFDIKL